MEGSHSSKIADRIESEINRMEKVFSPTIENSDVYNINKAEKNVWVNVSKETMDCLEICQEIHLLSDGYFDPTVYPLLKLWKFDGKSFLPSDSSFDVPQKEKIKEVMSCVGFSNLIIDKENLKVKKLNSQTQMDFGAIAKGYAIGKSMKIANSQKNYFINFGGNVAGFGKTFNIGITHPRKQGNVFAYFDMKSYFSASTSGDYERYNIANDTRYHHIINPKTGYPSGFDKDGNQLKNRLLSVTIVSNEFAKCDALATATLLLGQEKGAEFLEKYNNAHNQKLSAFMVNSKLENKNIGNIKFKLQWNKQSKWKKTNFLKQEIY